VVSVESSCSSLEQARPLPVAQILLSFFTICKGKIQEKISKGSEDLRRRMKENLQRTKKSHFSVVGVAKDDNWIRLVSGLVDPAAVEVLYLSLADTEEHVADLNDLEVLTSHCSKGESTDSIGREIF